MKPWPGLARTCHRRSQNDGGRSPETVTCGCHQRAEPDAHALHFQVHDREAARGHQLFELLSQLQGQGHGLETLTGRDALGFAPTLTHSPRPRRLLESLDSP